MKLAIVIGTRPEIIKMSPIIRQAQQRQLDYCLVHTGQHYSVNMDRIFFEELGLPTPGHNLHVGSGSHAEETGNMMIGLEKVFLAERPSVVLVEGDTNSVLAAALTATKLRIPVAHVEAGCRSFDRNMPEEINRVLTDHISNILFAPTRVSRENLLKEGISSRKIHVTGNTIVDAVLQNTALENRNNVIPMSERLERNRYLLVTLHRQENVDSSENLSRLVQALELVGLTFNLPVLWPVHPRTRKRLVDFSISEGGHVRLMQPVGYITFLRLLKDSALALTDSGGVQEEACILKVPCVTLRQNTELPETIELGCNRLAGPDSESILNAAKFMMRAERNWSNPYGDGHAAERILQILVKSDRNHFLR